MGAAKINAGGQKVFAFTGPRNVRAFPGDTSYVMETYEVPLTDAEYDWLTGDDPVLAIASTDAILFVIESNDIAIAS